MNKREIKDAKQLKPSLNQKEGTSEAIRYVNFLLYNMFQNREAVRILRRSEPPLPLTVSGKQRAAPSFDELINRLKILTRLEPVMSPTPKSGTTSLVIRLIECELHCRFDDHSDECCRIELKRKESAKPAPGN